MVRSRSLHNRHVVAPLLITTTALLAGCGGGGDAGGGTAATPAGTATAAVDQALAARVPEAIKSDGKIVVGVDATYAPNEFLDADGRTVVGFDVDLFNAVAAKLGLQTEWQPSPFDTIIPGVGSGKYEIGVSSFTVNDRRKQQANMVSYFNAGTQWATKPGNPAGVDPNNPCGKKIAVQRGTVQADEDLPARQKKCAGNPMQIDQYQGQDEASAAVVSGKDDAMLADSPVVAYAVKQSNGQLQPLGDIYDAAPYGYVIKKDQAEFARVVADAVNAVIADSTYRSVLEKWGVQQGGIPTSSVNP
jgi:polar amino acid transport system substrate-binding protein